MQVKIRGDENKQPHTAFLLKKFTLQFVVKTFFRCWNFVATYKNFFVGWLTFLKLLKYLRMLNKHFVGVQQYFYLFLNCVIRKPLY